MRFRLTFLIVTFIAGIFPVNSQILTLQGQLSGWTYLSGEKFSDSQLGIRYIPSLFAEKYFPNNLSVDAELSVNTVGAATFDNFDRFLKDASLQPYRMWLRFAGSQFELRGGLQKIDFGTSTLLRSLRWFDSIDPRDPLQLTTGVYGVLGKYYFLNNANLWVWGLYGNGDPKGWEIFGTADDNIEFGGRVQYPIATGELGFSYHQRKYDFNKNILGIMLPAERIVPEQRYALDGKWDLEVGLWFETTLTKQDLSFADLLFKYRNFLTLGVDYTFGVGTGLYTMAEHLVISQGNELSKLQQSTNFTAWTANYSLGLLDRISAIVYYDWNEKQVFRFASISRLYNQWSIYVNLFWNPEDAGLGIGDLRPDMENTFGVGKGIQIMAVFNH